MTFSTQALIKIVALATRNCRGTIDGARFKTKPSSRSLPRLNAIVRPRGFTTVQDEIPKTFEIFYEVEGEPVYQQDQKIVFLKSCIFSFKIHQFSNFYLDTREISPLFVGRILSIKNTTGSENAQTVAFEHCIVR